MHPQSVCILGRQPALGLAELESLYGAAAVRSISPQAAGLSLHASEVDFGRLGGSTRLAHVMAVLPTTDWKTLASKLPELITELALTLPDGKIQLGLSSFGLSVTPAKLNATGLTLKKTLRDRIGRSMHVTPNPACELNTAQVLHNHLTGPTGIELLCIATSDGRTVIARTTKVQDIASYTLRDRGRPKRDARVGMLPPKLAQIIINLAVAQNPPAQDCTVLDPFCGTGVLLQEALLMGYSACGADIEPRMVDFSEQNLDWAISRFHMQGASVQLAQGDATSYEWRPAPQFVASEAYLGRPFTTRPSPEVLAQTVSEVNLIIKKFLRNIHGQLKPDTRLCLAVPAWLSNTAGPNMSRLDGVQGAGAARTEPYLGYGEEALQLATTQSAKRSSGVAGSAGKQAASARYVRYLPLIDQISQLGYNRVRFEHVRDEQLLYYREDQIVARQLLVLTRK